MHYRDDMPDDVIENGNECTDSERQRITRGADYTLKVVQKSINNYNEKMFRKWFGKNNDKQPDWIVKQRIRNTYKFMKDGY